MVIKAPAQWTRWHLWRVFLILAIFFLSIPAAAQKEVGISDQEDVRAAIDLKESFEKAILSETENLDRLTEQSKLTESNLQTINTELNAYKIQNSVHSSLLLLPPLNTRDLERAFGENKKASDALSERLKDFRKKIETVEALNLQTQEQLKLSKKELLEIKSGRWSKAEKADLLNALQRFQKILKAKEAILERLQKKQNEIVASLEERKAATDLLSNKFEQEIRSKQKREILDRNYESLKRFSIEAFKEEIRYTVLNLSRLFQKGFWSGEAKKLRDAGPMPLFTFIMLLTIGIIFIVRIRAVCPESEDITLIEENHWRFVCLTLIRRSIVFLGIAFVLFAYDLIQFPHYRVPIIRMTLNIFLVWIISKWALDFLKIGPWGDKCRYINEISSRIRFVIVSLRLLSIVYIVFLWVLSLDSPVLLSVRLIVEIGVVLWLLTFWTSFRRARKSNDIVEKFPRNALQSFFISITYLVAFGGLVIEFAGYPALAVYWFVSWIKSAAVIFWAFILFMVIREWQIKSHKSETGSVADAPVVRHPVHLLFIQIAWLFWAMALIDGLVLAWGTNWEVVRTVYGFMGRTWSIGKIHLSLLGIIYAFLVLFFTYTLTRLVKFALEEKIFVKSTFDKGIQESITTVSIYLIWGFGLILSLGVLGVSATSLAVVFGALSIGIGFGLQTIFNNFVSGIILLFERPIQVGDAVEINGVWGEVKKINIRATVVQTYDNASLIIPNSEFISKQVNNLSFKDQRLRRKINIGVAYGSDVELVRKTLLEIASENKNVFKVPEPDVLFMDHGDSTLVFTLRYWTILDLYYTTSTEIRFEIDRLFRKRGIEIAFPQRDIHIRSVVKNGKIEIDSRDDEDDS